jgi:hypothetical protein
MNTVEKYAQSGFIHAKKLIPTEVARAFMSGIKQDIGSDPIRLSDIRQHGAVLTRPAFEVYGNDYRPMSFFLWALTPAVSSLVGRDLLPTYDYFRIYREGDICLVHADRPSCEHSVSLTLDYSDGETWDLQIAREATPRGQPLARDFGTSPFLSVPMEVGDAVIYRGVHHRHGRMDPNPNGWSAHLFLHFVERGGPYENYAFDKRVNLSPVNFGFS